MQDVENLLQLDEPDFTFGEDGDLIQFTPGQPLPATPTVTRGAQMHSDVGASARVRREHEEGQQGGDQVSLAMKFYFVLYCTYTCALKALSFYTSTHHSP